MPSVKNSTTQAQFVVLILSIPENTKMAAPVSGYMELPEPYQRTQWEQDEVIKNSGGSQEFDLQHFSVVKTTWTSWTREVWIFWTSITFQCDQDILTKE